MVIHVTGLAAEQDLYRCSTFNWGESSRKYCREEEETGQTFARGDRKSGAISHTGSS